MNARLVMAVACGGLLAIGMNGPSVRAVAEENQLKAFPGAEGWGAASVGGRGGKVIKVTNLNASGPGSLADACAMDGPRIVVFEVSGVIRGNIRITKPHITIAGQTAPGAGITVEGAISTYNYGTHDVIVRHLRVRRQRDMGSLAAELAQAAIFVGEHAHHAVRAAVAAGMDPASCHAVATVADAADRLGQELRPGDLVFVKGRATDHLSRALFAQLGPIGCWRSRCRVRSVCDLCWALRPGFDLPAALSAPLPPAGDA